MRKTRVVTCLKCKCEFESELDKQGVPYNRLCKKHRNMTENEHWTESLRDLSLLSKVNRRKRSSSAKDVLCENGMWNWYNMSGNWDILFSHEDENEVIKYRNEKLLEKALNI